MSNFSQIILRIPGADFYTVLLLFLTKSVQFWCNLKHRSTEILNKCKFGKRWRLIHGQELHRQNSDNSLLSSPSACSLLLWFSKARQTRQLFKTFLSLLYSTCEHLFRNLSCSPWRYSVKVSPNFILALKFYQRDQIQWFGYLLTLNSFKQKQNSKASKNSCKITTRA